MSRAPTRRGGALAAGALAAGALAAPALVLAAQGLRTARATYLPEPAYGVEATVGQGAGAALRLAVLGDSTVAGIGTPGPQATLPVLLAERVAARLRRPVTVRGLGVSGARTADVAGQQAAALARRPAEAVCVVVGSNDATHALPPWRMRAATRRMLGRVRAAAPGAPVVLGGIPEFHTVPAVPWPLRRVLGTEADLLRAAQRAAAADAGVRFVDIRALASPRFLADPASMSADDFHPSDVGYGYWADALAPALAAAVRAGRARR